MTIGQRLRKVRDDLGMSRVQFGKMIGVPPSSLKNYENEYRMPHFELFQKLDACMMTRPIVHWVITGREL